jgi:transposase-like protein
MPRTHPPYAPEYRRRIIELARTGRPIAQLAREFEASANAIRKWVKQAGLDEGLRNDGLTTGDAWLASPQTIRASGEIGKLRSAIQSHSQTSTTERYASERNAVLMVAAHQSRGPNSGRPPRW